MPQADSAVISHDMAQPSEAAGGNFLQWLVVVALVYLLISAVSVIGSGFKVATGDHAQQLFEFASNPFVGLMIGIMATALIQSSSTVSSIIVGMVAGGLPVVIAIPMIFGSNIGTTVTNTLVSLGHVRDKDEFRRAFSAATVHDFFNFIAVAIFLPLELMFGFLDKMARGMATALAGGGEYSMSGLNFVKTATAPAVDTMTWFGNLFPGLAAGLVMIALGIALIFFSIRYIGKLLKVLMVGRAKKILHAAIGRGPVAGIASGATVTVLVQSSSTTTSLIVPLAGSGTFSLREIYPFTLGTNIGTTITALLAATAVTGMLAVHALEIALIHLLFNLFAVILIFSVPFLRTLPLMGANWLGKVATENKLIAAVWVLGMFIVIPLILILVTAIL